MLEKYGALLQKDGALLHFSTDVREGIIL